MVIIACGCVTGGCWNKRKQQNWTWVEKLPFLPSCNKEMKSPIRTAAHDQFFSEEESHSAPHWYLWAFLPFWKTVTARLMQQHKIKTERGLKWTWFSPLSCSVGLYCVRTERVRGWNPVLTCPVALIKMPGISAVEQCKHYSPRWTWPCRAQIAQFNSPSLKKSQRELAII